MKKDISIEYSHIYTNNNFGDEQKFSIEVLENIVKENPHKTFSFVVLVDDYSFPDPEFSYDSLMEGLIKHDFKPDIILRESQLIPLCDGVIHLIKDKNLKDEISEYIRLKKYPCSLFIATWYLLRLGCIQDSILSNDFVGNKLINILPLSFKPFEDKALEIIKSTEFSENISDIKNEYFEGRSIE